MIQIQRARPLATVRCLRGAAALVAVGLLGAVPSGCSSGPTMAEWADQADGVIAESLRRDNAHLTDAAYIGIFSFLIRPKIEAELNWF